MPAGTYFVVADAAPLGAVDALAFCRELPARAGVVGVPVSVFHDDVEAARTLVRFAFCKRDERAGRGGQQAGSGRPRALGALSPGAQVRWGC